MAQPPKTTSKLPQVPLPGKATPRPQPPPLPTDTASDRQSRQTVLVVEDDAAMRDLLEDSLRDEGYRVETAAGGHAGVARVQKGGIDLVVTDVRMPDLDGLDMLREIKSAPLEQPPHVIVITAFGSIDTAIKAVRLGAHDYIIGRSPLMQEVFGLIRRLSGSTVNVLITGESGTG